MFRGYEFTNSVPLLIWPETNLSEHVSPTNAEENPMHFDRTDGALQSCVHSQNTGSGSSRSGSRNSTLQKRMSKAVRTRDGYQCVACDFASLRVHAAHVYPVAARPWDVEFAATGLSDLYGIQIAITLCADCHYYFDEGLWFVDPTDRVTTCVSPRAHSVDHLWLGRLRSRLRLPTSGLTNWPSASTFAIQSAHYRAREELRDRARQSRPYQCPTCLARFVTPVSEGHRNKCPDRSLSDVSGSSPSSSVFGSLSSSPTTASSPRSAGIAAVFDPAVAATAAVALSASLASATASVSHALHSDDEKVDAPP